MGPRLSDVETRVYGRRTPCTDRASMGPRLFRRGNCMYVHVPEARILLQWGHVFSDVETPACFSFSMSPTEASMGPRLFRRGNREHTKKRRGGR